MKILKTSLAQEFFVSMAVCVINRRGQVEILHGRRVISELFSNFGNKNFKNFPASDFRCAPGAKAQGASGSLENMDAVHVFARFARSFCPWRRSP
jgi:hypothetical protein